MKDMIAAVRISEVSCTKHYDPAGINLKIGDFCFVEVKNKDYEEMGYVVSLEGCKEDIKQQRNLPKVIRKATEEEIEKWKILKVKEREALALCKEKVKKHNLNMKVTNVRFDEKNNKVVFNFIADKRVDFRELVKDLAASLKSRIDLWQIGVRDEARMLCGYGICGEPLCCSRYIKEFQTISIKMAKDQDIFVSPTKLSGVCGRLMCCLTYECEHYQETNKTAPPIGAIVGISSGSEGFVIERNLIKKTVVIEDSQNNRVKATFDEITFVKVPENLEIRQREILKSKVETTEDIEEIPPDDVPINGEQKQ